MKLYDIAQEYRGLVELVDSGELTPEMVSDTFGAIKAEFSDKALVCVKMAASIKLTSNGILAEIERLQNLHKQSENNHEKLVDYIKNQMLAIGNDKLDLGIFKLTIPKSRPKLGGVDEKKVPAEFWVTIPATKSIDRAALLAARKLGVIDGVELGESKRSLQIK